jgi:hypothetical protein
MRSTRLLPLLDQHRIRQSQDDVSGALCHTRKLFAPARSPVLKPVLGMLLDKRPVQAVSKRL